MSAMSKLILSKLVKSSVSVDKRFVSNVGIRITDGGDPVIMRQINNSINGSKVMGYTTVLSAR